MWSFFAFFKFFEIVCFLLKFTFFWRWVINSRNTTSTASATKGDRVILVHVDLSNKGAIAEDLDEFQQLAAAAGATVLAIVTAKRPAPDPKYFIGSGKVTAIQEQVMALGATLVILNHTLSPSQERNLEETLKCRVLDRTGLILDIFAQRARTFEGKLQVELAQLEHLAVRLKRGWTHLERQRGGIGLRGPGETQLETDRRLVRQRVATIKKRLERVRNQRQQSQRGRKRAALPVIALIGYTNAGKSTIFNRLTRAAVYVADKLFATLDPTLRKIYIPNVPNPSISESDDGSFSLSRAGREAVIADTVGFVRHLPHELVEAFRATLEETKDADLLLHVVDASDAERLDKIRAVDAVLQQIGAESVPQLLIYNKIDLMENRVGNEEVIGGEESTAARVDYDERGVPQRVWISAKSGAGMDALLQALAKALTMSVKYS